MSDQPWRGPRVSSSLRVVVHRDPLATCETCSGDGVFLDENGADHDCPCCEDTYEEPTVAAMAADRGWVTRSRSGTLHVSAEGRRRALASLELVAVAPIGGTP